MQKQKNKKKTFKSLQSLADSGDKTSCFGGFLKPYFQNHLFYFFHSKLENV